MDSMKANAGGSLRAVLKGLNLSEYTHLLERQDLDIEILADVKEEQLERIGVKTLGQRLKILGAAKKAETRSKEQSGEKPEETKLRGNSSQEEVERDDATKTVVEGKPDEAKRKESEERKLKENRDKSSVGKNDGKIDDKSETFLQNQRASLGGSGFSKTTLKDPPSPDQEWKSPFKPSSDSSEDSCEGMSTTGGLLYTAAVTALKMMEAK